MQSKKEINQLRQLKISTSFKQDHGRESKLKLNQFTKNKAEFHYDFESSHSENSIKDIHLIAQSKSVSNLGTL